MVIFILMFVLRSYCQEDFVNSKIQETKDIMTYWGIPIRPNYLQDGKISYIVDSSFPQLRAEFMAIGKWKGLDSIALLSRTYTKPEIRVSKFIDSQLKARDSTIYYFFAIHTVIHELCHYLQAGYVGQGYVKPEADYNDYVRQPIETQAFGVGGYYFLRALSPRYLNVVLESNIKPEYQMLHVAHVVSCMVFSTPLLKSD